MLSRSTKNRIIGGIVLFGAVAFTIKLIDGTSSVRANHDTQDDTQVQCITSSTFIGPTSSQPLQVEMITEVSSFEETTSKVQESNASSVPDQEKVIESQIEEIEPEAVETEPYLEMTESDVYELATLVYLESGTESYECQKAIASVVIHRMQNDDLTLQEVIYAKNQFSPAYLIAESHPSDSTLAAVKDVLQNGPSIPNYVTFFRADYYHDWSELIVPYCVIDHTYFSADVRLME